MNLKRLLSVLACLFILSAARAVSLRDANGRLVPGTDRDNPAVWARRPAKLTRGAAPGQYSKSRIFFGKENVLVILVDFPDRHFIIDDSEKLRQKYSSMLNDKDYSDIITFQGTRLFVNGSAKDYFIDQSYGMYEPSFNVIGPITASQNHEVYGKDISKNNDAASVDKLVKEICNKLPKDIDLDSYLPEGDSVIEHLAIIYAGRGQNFNEADPDDIWPQCNSIRVQTGKVRQIQYLCTCELFWNTDDILDGIGTFCHEFSHTIGLPDYYCTRKDYDNDVNAILGHWSLMDYGNYENEGFSPAGYTAFERFSLGWLELTDINAPGKYTLEELNGDKPAAYRLNTVNDDCFLILENHQQHGWYKYQKTKGLMVTAVAYNQSDWANNAVNYNTSNKRYYLLPADNISSRKTESTDLYPWADMDSLTWYSRPQLGINGIFKPFYNIFDIRDNDGIVSFIAGTERPTGVDSQSLATPIQVFDLSGRLRMTVTQESDIPSGLWIIKQGNETKKVKR